MISEAEQRKLYQEAIRRRDEGMAQVEAGAERVLWPDYAHEFIERYARRNPTVFVDDLWADGLEFPPNRKALGPAMRRAAVAGFIEKTGEYRPSVNSNLLPKPVWRSLIYDGVSNLV